MIPELSWQVCSIEEDPLSTTEDYYQASFLLYFKPKQCCSLVRCRRQDKGTASEGYTVLVLLQLELEGCISC